MEINGEYYCREKAILIYRGKIYEDEQNHQYALQKALEEYGDSVENHIEDERENNNISFIEGNIEALSDYTFKKSMENELFTFSNFGNKYLVAHTKENLFLNLELIKNYADKNNLKLAYHEDFLINRNDIVII